MRSISGKCIRYALLIAILLTALARVSDPVSIKFFRNIQVFISTPAYVTFSIHVPSHANNRYVVFEVYGAGDNPGDYYTRSEIQIDGASDKVIFDRKLQIYDAGDYQIRATLYRTDERFQAVANFHIGGVE